MSETKKTETVVEVPQSPQPSSGLNMQDLTLVLSIIDTVAQRGAIHGGEMEEVGKLRSKVAKFVQDNTKPEK